MPALPPISTKPFLCYSEYRHSSSKNSPAYPLFNHRHRGQDAVGIATVRSHRSLIGSELILSDYSVLRVARFIKSRAMGLSQKSSTTMDPESINYQAMFVSSPHLGARVHLVPAMMRLTALSRTSGLHANRTDFKIRPDGNRSSEISNRRYIPRIFQKE